MARTTVEIARPPDEVFAFVTDPTKLSAWQDAEEVQQLTEGPGGQLLSRDGPVEDVHTDRGAGSVTRG